MNTDASEREESRLRVLVHQEKLHEWSRSDSERRFCDLFNLVSDRATLEVAFELVEANKGSRTPGVDGLTPTRIKKMGKEGYLSRLRDELKSETYSPQPLRRVEIPKKNGKIRKLGILTIRDRIVQMALKLVLEPIFEADFYPHSYGYRPNRRAQDAIEEIFHLHNKGYVWVLEGDIKACFDNVNHSILMGLVKKRIGDRKVLELIWKFLRAGVLTAEADVVPTLTGTQQGGIISPLLSNIYLSDLDRHFSEIWEREMFTANRRSKLRKSGKATYLLVRYSDDFVVLINGTEEHARQIKEEATEVLEKRLKMELSTEKTLITHIDEGYEFLGFKIFRTTRGNGGKRVVLTIPSKASLASVMNKVKKVACRNTHMTLAQIITVVNPILRGWVNYFRHAVSKRTFSYLNYYSWWRLIRWLRKKHKGMTWKELRRRYYGKDRIRDGDLILYNPATQPVTRYRYRGTKIAVNWDRFRLREKILTPVTSPV